MIEHWPARRALPAILSLLGAVVPALAHAQAPTDYRTFNFFFENDAFVNSDTGYTNGIRLSWSLARTSRDVRRLSIFGVPWALARLGLARPLGIDIAAVSRLPCQPTDTRDTREDGRCLLLDLGIGQTMYTPDSLTDPHLEPRDRPYAGFLFASVGATSLDAPRMRDPESRFVMTQLSNMVIVGVTGPLAQARETQSLAHWTWSSGAVRPLGWHNQLRNAPQAALVTELHARPAGWELCNIRNGQGKRIGCGSIDERRQFDVTPRAEAVIGTYLRRASLGTVVRAGSRFPDVVSLSRIPTTRIFGRAREEGRSVWKRIVPEPYWWYGFAALDGRYVQHNSFIEGGYRDGGTDGWRSRRLIDARRTLAEGAVGVSVGNSSMTLTVQHIHRTPEYDVRDAPRAKGMHRYVTLNLAMFTRPGAH